LNANGIAIKKRPAADGRATFAYGDEVLPGEPHLSWRRVGAHDVLADTLTSRPYRRIAARGKL
jgi:hypothetical protein